MQQELNILASWWNRFAAYAMCLAVLLVAGGSIALMFLSVTNADKVFVMAFIAFYASGVFFIAGVGLNAFVSLLVVVAGGDHPNPSSSVVLNSMEKNEFCKTGVISAGVTAVLGGTVFSLLLDTRWEVMPGTPCLALMVGGVILIIAALAALRGNQEGDDGGEEG